MSVIITTVPVTVTASQSVLVVTSTIAASQLSIATANPTESANSVSATASSANQVSRSLSAGDSTSLTSPSGTASSSDNSAPSHPPIGGIVGGAVGGVALIAFILLLACLFRKRRKAKKDANLFPANSVVMTDAASALPLLGADRSIHGGSHTGAHVSEAHSSHLHRPSAASLAPSFIMGSSASFPHSHGSHYGQPLNGALSGSSQDYPGGFANGYPDVHRTAFYEPPMPPAVDPRIGPSAKMIDPRAHVVPPGMASLPTGAAPSDYAALSEAARWRGMQQAPPPSTPGFEPAWSGAASLNDASSHRGSHGSSLAMHPAVMQFSEEPGPIATEAEHLQRRPPAARFPGQQSKLDTIPGSVAVSEIASGDHHWMHSGATSQRGDLSVPPKLPSIPASSPLILQGATSFAPQNSLAVNAVFPAAVGLAGPSLTAEAGADTFQSSNGTYNSDGTYNTYTGAVKGQLRVVGESTEGPMSILEEASHSRAPRRDMSGDSKNGEFWVDASEKAQLGAAGRRLGQHSANNSTWSINKTGSRMIEMLDTDEQPNLPTSVTGPDEPSRKQIAAPSRPSFWKERTKSSQSITKVFRNSPLTGAHAAPSDRSPAMSTNSARFGGALADSAGANGISGRAAETEHLPLLDLGKSATSSADSPKPMDGEADMWKESSMARSANNAMRKWTRKKPGKSASKGNEVDVDELFG
ncbi:hypothetical protein NDA11_007883 [Ustilago hordei]|uniref:Uncharacterized protein n=1 Tax=Ustilago hordei TaxID=120017 RepID=I2FX98_USTHO|nr:uncharacterized protein UHO2_04382 [Ustilago hordei]KAJ1036934.1 hypothetical protein NDA10_002462 [Ustilago hordei]KAJ1573758.1 hypothetical protein NDA15_003129 [Ustilago hordei]KAJ1579494.1 hypothetical protein NDA11_007883 [Ustilago hordei]KAJ1579783.1 hypothetical protein NDA12_007082 [Ustilago hordei]KAJ1598740.1 hypothetical protein NDA14_007977 [Ustilago hordei]